MVTGLHEHTLAVVGCRTGADARMSCQNREKGAQKRENLQQALNSCSLCVPGCMRTKCGKQVCSRCRCNSCKSTRWKFWAQAKWSEVDHHWFVYTTHNVVLLSKQEEKKQCSASLHSPEVFHRQKSPKWPWTHHVCPQYQKSVMKIRLSQFRSPLSHFVGQRNIFRAPSGPL